MKATGIIRRIDDLGRVVIPKEIRRSMSLKEGDAMEIYLEDDRVIFQKYQITKASNYLDEAIRVLAENDKHNELRSVLEQISRMIADSETEEN